MLEQVNFPGYYSVILRKSPFCEEKYKFSRTAQIVSKHKYLEQVKQLFLEQVRKVKLYLRTRFYRTGQKIYILEYDSIEQVKQ